MPQVRECACDAIITPAAVFARKPDHQRLDFRTDPGAAGIDALPRPVELLSNQASVPAENGIWFGHSRDVVQRLATKPFSDLGQRGSFWIGQPQPIRQMASQDAILGDQVLMAKQQLLIDEPRDERQQPCPMESIAHSRTLIITTSLDKQPSARSHEYFYHTGSNKCY